MELTAESLAQLRRGSLDDRRAAAELCAQLGEEARAAAVPLVEACGDLEEVNQWAVAALEDLGPPAADDLAELTRLLQSPHELVVYWALTLIGRLGAQATPALPAIAELLVESSSRTVRQRAIWVLEQMGPAAHSAAPTLRAISAAKDPILSGAAARTLTTWQL